MPEHVPAFPTIRAVTWLAAREVLGGEASHFTPWLEQASSLEVLGTALGLEELTAVRTEHNVLGKRLDILAQALDENGEEVPVCIENQYGTSDADHLGRLIAYLAQQERGRAVWIVERAHEAFVAGVRFLNRTSTDEVGYYLVQVKFTHGLDDGYQVHFEVLAAPLAWERGSSAKRPVNVSKVEFMNAVLERVRSDLTALGFPSMNTHTRGAYLWVQWPRSLWIRDASYRLDIRATQDDASVVVYVNELGSKAANVEGAAVLRERVASPLEASLPAGTVIDWDTVGSGTRKPIRIVRAGGGYTSGEPESTAAWAVEVCRAVLDTVQAHPVHDLAEIVSGRLGGAAEGTGLNGDAGEDHGTD